jgi:hypothetical protein
MEDMDILLVKLGPRRFGLLRETANLKPDTVYIKLIRLCQMPETLYIVLHALLTTP